MLKKYGVIVCTFLLLLSIFLFPIFSHFSTHTTSPNDGPLIIWLINQSQLAWSGQGSWYDWPFFYPYRYTATYSDPFLTAGLFLTLIKPFTQNTVIQHNLFIVLGTVTNFFAMFVLAQALWKRRFISVIVSSFFTFSFLQLQFIVHLHTYLLAGIPLGLYALVRYSESQHIKYLLLFSLSFLSQAMNAPFTAYFFGTVVGTYLLSEGLWQKFILDRRIQLMLLLSISLCIWYYIPYVVTAERYQAIRTIRDTAHFSLPITKLVGLEILIPVSIIWLVHFLGKKRAQNKPTVLHKRTCILLALIGGFAMLGPVVKIGTETFKIFSLPIPLPYAVAYYLIPGIQAFRAVSRWSVVLNIGLSLGIGWALAHATLSKKVVSILVVVWLTTMIGLFYKDYPLFEIKHTVPPIYAVVQKSPGNVLVELPISQWDMVPFEKSEDERMLYQLEHGMKLYNGFSGFMPPERSQDIVLHFAEFPNSRSLEKLQNAGVDLVLIHYDEFQAMETAQFTYFGASSPSTEKLRALMESSNNFEKISCTDQPDDCLYILKPN